MYFIQAFELDVSRWMFALMSAAIRASRKKPAPKWGMMNGSRGQLTASACTSSGWPRRASNRLGTPSFLRAPTESTPQ
jgi:hypothetical protein